MRVNAEVVVTGGGDKHGFAVSFGQSLALGLRVVVSAERHGDDVGAVSGGIVDGLDDCGDIAGAVALEGGEGHDEGVGVGAGDAYAVAAGSGGDAGAVGAVAVVVAHARRLIHEVPAVDVVAEAVEVVVVVVDAVSLFGVGPDVVGEVGVGDVDAGVDDGDDGALGVGEGLLLEFVKADGGDAPLLRIEGVGGVFGGGAEGVDQIVGLGILDLAEGGEFAGSSRNSGPWLIYAYPRASTVALSLI